MEYEVQDGDTLYGIAKSNGTTYQKLLQHPRNAKYRSNPNLIYPGDIVYIPNPHH